MEDGGRPRVWPASLKGRFSVALSLASVLLFLVIYVATSLVTGYSMWPVGADTTVNVLVPIGLGGLALVSGLLLGLTLAKVIRVPLEHFVDYIRGQSVAAIEGRTEEVGGLTGLDLPLELQELSDTVEQLVQQLSQRQGALRDATEQALDSEQAFRAVVNASSEVKLLMRGGLVEIANPAAAEFFDKPLGALLGEPLSSAIAAYAVTTEDGEPLTADMLLSRMDEDLLIVHCLAEDGSERWAECTVGHPQGDRDLSLLTVHDVTERRALEQLRTEVVSIVSHDLRAPLTVVSGYLDMLAADVPEPRRSEVVAKARAATSRMAEMLEDLLDSARAGDAAIATRRAPVSLGELAEDVASSLPSHPGHELVIEQRADVIVLGDAGRLRRALTNLLMNALKHTAPGTMISLLVDADGGDAVLAVEDSGAGVPEEHRGHIFERYTRLDAQSGGAGLGLYIVKTVAEGHGGEAYVEDSGAGGARFVMRLPLAEGEGRS